MGDGAANAALSYLFDTTGNKGVSRAGGLPGLAGALFSPYEALRDPNQPVRTDTRLWSGEGISV